MKTAKRVLAVFMAVIMATLLSVAVFAESGTSNTEKLMSQISAAGKFKASVTCFSYNSGTVRNNINFDFYDDLNSNKILCDFTDKNIKVLYADSSMKVIFASIIYLDLNKDVSLLLAAGAVDLFQKVFKSFVDDPMMSAFTLTTSTVEKNGKACTKEYFKGKAIGTSGTFYYDQNGNLCELELCDNQGEYISFTIASITTSFDSSVFSLPAFAINLSVIWKLIMVLLPLFGVTLAI